MNPPPKRVVDELKRSNVNLKSLVLVTKDWQVLRKDLTQDEKVSWVEIDDAEVNGTSSKMKILVVTPLHPAYGIRHRAKESIQLAIDSYDGPVDWIISKGDNPYLNPFENVTHQHNKARRMALAGGYDALLSLEADMIVPPDTIARLIEANSDIAYGLYISRHKPYRWLAFKELTLWGGTSVSLDPTGEEARLAWGKIIDVVGAGMGCTLIRSNVLEALPFRLHDGKHSWIQEEYAEDFRRMGIDPYREHRGMVCDDYLLALDAQHYGITQRANLNVVCGHIAEEGTYWPDLTMKKLYRIDPI
jgi:hypothetical protein